MCEHGDTVTMMLAGEMVEIDRCIADLVGGLNSGGMETTESCCGHGRGDGVIFLRDGRVLVVEPNRRG